MEGDHFKSLRVVGWHVHRAFLVIVTLIKDKSVVRVCFFYLAPLQNGALVTSYYLKTTYIWIKGLTLAVATFFGYLIDRENQVRDAVLCLVIDLFEVSSFIRNIHYLVSNFFNLWNLNCFTGLAKQFNLDVSSNTRGLLVLETCLKLLTIFTWHYTKGRRH